VLRRAPEHAKAHAGLGFVLSEQGRHADAIAHYRAALAADAALRQSPTPP
jgi:Tfp pilus assembly protein PilF